jgi:hypothetical protein
MHNFPCTCIGFRQVVVQPSQAIEKFSPKACARFQFWGFNAEGHDNGLEKVEGLNDKVVPHSAPAFH